MDQYPINETFLTTRFPTAGLSAPHVRADWLLDWSLAAEWARLLSTYLTAAYPTQQRSKHVPSKILKW